jgi:hypothetical protein
MQVKPVALVTVNGYLVNGREADAQRRRHLSFSTPPVATRLGMSAMALRRRDDALVHVLLRSVQFRQLRQHRLRYRVGGDLGE